MNSTLKRFNIFSILEIILSVYLILYFSQQDNRGLKIKCFIIKNFALSCTSSKVYLIKKNF